MGYWEGGIGKGVLRRVIVKGKLEEGYWEGKIEKGALRRER